MRDWLRAQAEARPHAPALMMSGAVWRFEDLDRLTDRAAALLAARGVASGGRVGALLPNTPNYLVLIYALARLGAVLVPLNMRLTAPELAWQLESAACEWLVIDETTADRMTASEFPTLALINTRDFEIETEWTPPTVDWDENSTQAIVFTSGTSGQPKGVELTFGNHYASATASAFRLGTLPEDRWLCTLPLYHVGGLALVLRCCLYGTVVVLQDGFHVEQVIDTLERDSVTLISLVPTMLHRLMNAAGGVEALRRTRLILLGGASAGAELITHAASLGLPVAPTYGLSEACSQVATLVPADAAAKPGSVGRPLLFSRVRVVDENGYDVAADSYGEVWVQGPTVMRGYFRDPEATNRALRDGWLRTGDIGYLDADGDLWLVQRRSDLIVTGGENVYPAEVEQVLLSHPAVAAACVVGVRHREWGQQVAAAVVLHDGLPVPAEELLAFTRERLAGYKQPRRIRFVESLPQTASGKIHRSAVADLFR